MDNQNKQIAFSVIGIIIVVLALFFYLRDPDIAFSRNVLVGLATGRQQVAKLIDWNSLKALDVDIGDAYSKLPTDKDRQGYKRAFIQNFSVGFKQADGKLREFHHWRIKTKDSVNTIIAASYRDKVLLFTLIHKYGKRWLVGVQWE